MQTAVSLPKDSTLSNSSDETALKDAKVQGRHFLDPQGRVVLLKGINVGGISKVPSSDVNIDWQDPTQASYINHPFPLSSAPTHFKRLYRWGLRFLRITVTWEAIEHLGPGQFDDKFLSYLKELLQIMTDQDLVCYVCLHQDVFSRFSGGSGAPAWVLESAGFDLSNGAEKLEECGAAYLGGLKCRGKRWEGDRGLWPTGYQKLACASMNTLFWAGETLAPSLLVTDPTSSSIEKINIQTYLQGRFLKMFEVLVDSVGAIDGVLGFEMMNEPHPGYIGMASLHEFNYNTDLHLGPYPSPLQSFALGAGNPTKVPVYVRTWPHPTKIGKYEVLNPQGVIAWKLPTESRTKISNPCIWAKEGVWAYDSSSSETPKPVVLKEGYFSKKPDGSKLDFYNDCYWPFVKKWEEMIFEKTKGLTKDGKGKLGFVEGVPNEFCPVWPEEVRPRNLVFAPHWYDLNAMFKKQFGFMSVNVQGLSRGMFFAKALYFGRDGAKSNYSHQIRNIVTKAYEKLGECPVVMGETGIPMDLNNEKAFRTGDWSWHEIMMEALMSGYESAMIGYNLWCYNAFNTDAIGDDWNSENFSYYSDINAKRELAALEAKGLTVDADAQLDLGGKLLKQIVRPYALKTAGVPTFSNYDSLAQLYAFSFANPSTVAKVESAIINIPPLKPNSNIPLTSTLTEFFLPPYMIEYHKRGDLLTYCSDGKIEIDVKGQRALYRHSNTKEGFRHHVRILAKRPEGEEPRGMDDFGLYLAGAITIAVLAYLYWLIFIVHS